jgi:phosphatidylserine decarboxylase
MSENKKNPNNGVKIYSKGELVEEKIDKQKALKFLCINPVGKLIGWFLNQSWFSWLVGVWADSSISKFSIKKFIKKYNINVSESEKEVFEFKNFNDFFIRKLKTTARVIKRDPDVVISPCDSKAFFIKNIKQQDSFFVKNNSFVLESFLQDKNLASVYTNGPLMLFRLAPYDYHRIHFPVDCIPSEYKVINGIYNSVNPIVYRAGYQPLTENERHLITLKTEKFSEVIMVVVGARCVGKIVETYKPNTQCCKGDEVGYFSFGASSIVLLFKEGLISCEDEIIKHSLEDYETVVQFGEVVARKRLT